MRTKLLLTGIAALFLAMGTAHAGMCDNYLCGEVEVQVCLVKPGYNNGKFWSYQTNINIPLGSDPEHLTPNATSGLFVGEPGTDHKGTYYLKGKRYRCKDVSK